MTTTSTATAALTDYVIAEDAPLGVQLWPTRSPEFARNFTLARVAVIREEYGSFVEWTYESGNVRTFAIGEKVTVQL